MKFIKSILAQQDLSELGKSLFSLILWFLFSSVIGVLIGALSAVFGHTLIYVNNLRTAHPYLIYFLPLGGMLIVALYRGSRNTDDKGTNTVISALRDSSDIPFKMAPLIFISTTVTQLCGGSAGREGAALQLGGSIANQIGKLFRLNDHRRKVLIMCGMSAAFSGLFGTPLAAAFFSMEVASIGLMHYTALVPCVVASFSAHLIAKLLKVPPEVFPVEAIAGITPVMLLKITVFAVVVGIVSVLFCLLLHKTAHIYTRFIKNQYLRILLGGVLLILLTGCFNGRIYLGSGMAIIEQILHHGHPVPWYSFLLKMLFTAVTLGAGFKGGEIVPSFTIGAALGCVCANLLGLPMELVAACGMVGLFCGVTNSPVTSLLIAFELFGYQAMPFYIVTIAISYLISGSQSIYHTQKIAISKLV